MKIRIFKIITLLFLFCVTRIGFTSAYFLDQEVSSGNTFVTSSLDFSLRDVSDTPLSSPFFNISGMVPGNSETKLVRVKKDGDLDFQYSAKFKKVSGSDVLCDALELEAKLDGATVYNSNLSGFDLDPATIISAGADDWEFTIKLDSADSSLREKTCDFDFIFEGRQIGGGLSDEEKIGSIIATGSWALSGSVVINEIMWMGSTVHELDEWVELRNTTGSPINITGWKLYGAGPGPNEIVLGGTIEAHGYFLLSHYASGNANSAIKDSIIADQVDNSVHLTGSPGEQLTLKDTLDSIIDQTPTGSWVAGTHTSPATVEQSMERNNDPTTGWHTCIADACNDTTYWDAEGNNYGTPKAANLSENDPSATEDIVELVEEVTVPEVTPEETQEPTEEVIPSEPPVVKTAPEVEESVDQEPVTGPAQPAPSEETVDE
ncbi:MAG: lamin tail domain-containing protein [Patescibacteria group bacterium]